VFDVWKNVLAEVEREISHEAYTTWFDGAKLLEISDNIVKVEVPNAFKQRQLQVRYGKNIEKALENNGVKFDKIEYIVHSTSKVKRAGYEVTARNSGVERLGAITKQSGTYGKAASSFKNGLNPNYTLANFVIGTNNDLAVSVAKSIIEKPGGRFNPFFLYGGSGLGKTHLVQAIGNELLKKNPNTKVLYMATSDFYSEFINSIRNSKADNFSQKFRKLDVLIIDDFQMIVGKDASQAAFFDVFNDLYQRNKQIIVTSDRLPDQIKSVDVRLASRLAWTGPIDLQMPNFEDKCAILKSKAEFMGQDVSDDVIEYIADNIKTNIRDLEGELNRILLYSEVKNVSPSELISGGIISSKTSSHRNLVSAKKIVETVAKASDLKVVEMCGKSRVAHIKTARQIAMYLLSEELGMSTTKIALEVGVKDHTTVMHGIKKIKNDLAVNYNLRTQVEEIREKIYE